ncbi:MAG: hypothetical protein ABFS18_12815 [Thermodesulfobacteriota bacterium]
MTWTDIGRKIFARNNSELTREGGTGRRNCPQCGCVLERPHALSCSRCLAEIPWASGCSGCGRCQRRT